MTIPDGLWLNVGSGPTDAPGWTHLDGSWQAWLGGRSWLRPVGRALFKKEVGHWPKAVRYHDVRRGLPQAAESVAVLYSSHMLEHLHRADADRFLKEVHRVLKPGGVIRIVVPDLASIVGWYLDHRREVAEAFAAGVARTTGSSSDLLMDMLLLRGRSAPNQRGPLSWIRPSSDLHEHKWMYDAEGLRVLFAGAGFPEASRRDFLDSVIPKDRLALVEADDRVQDGAGICVEARK